MKPRGGYDVHLKGRPAARVEILPEVEELHLPLASRRFDFSELCVAEGQRVLPGQTVARDPSHHSVPLLAPRAGTVRLGAAEGHVTLVDVAHVAEERYHPHEDLEHVPKDMGSAGMRRYKLLDLGAWQFLHDAHTGELPDPFGVPAAVIVSTLNLEPFGARGSVLITKRLSSFTRGLEQVQSLLEYQPIYLVLPTIKSELAARIRETLRGYAWVKVVSVPLRYPFDNFAILARSLGLKADPQQPVWALRADGVLAIDRALTLSQPSTVRIVSVGGPGAASPMHLKAMPGYPVSAILDRYAAGGSVRVVSGGALTGRMLGPGQLGLGAECDGLTLLREHEGREFLEFMRPGLDRQSYSKCFLSSLRGTFAERFTTALRGERRPCVSCGFCEEVCPAGIMPHLIHKYLYQDALEEAERAGVDLCVGCGLCSFVCPSKIELRRQMTDASERIEQELHPVEAAE